MEYELGSLGTSLRAYIMQIDSNRPYSDLCFTTDLNWYEAEERNEEWAIAKAVERVEIDARKQARTRYRR
jgi:hypothetical protein